MSALKKLWKSKIQGRLTGFERIHGDQNPSGGSSYIAYYFVGIRK
jgi:hypothetical protein